jgi:hypothetical protein
MACPSVGIPGEVRYNACDLEADGSIERLGWISSSCIERDQRFAEFPSVLDRSGHESSPNPQTPSARVDDHLGNLATMRLVRRHGDQELDSADDLATAFRAEQHTSACGNFGQDVYKLEASGILV